MGDNNVAVVQADFEESFKKAKDGARIPLGRHPYNDRRSGEPGVILWRGKNKLHNEFFLLKDDGQEVLLFQHEGKFFAYNKRLCWFVSPAGLIFMPAWEMEYRGPTKFTLFKLDGQEITLGTIEYNHLQAGPKGLIFDPPQLSARPNHNYRFYQLTYDGKLEILVECTHYEWRVSQQGLFIRQKTDKFFLLQDNGQFVQVGEHPCDTWDVGPQGLIIWQKEEASNKRRVWYRERGNFFRLDEKGEFIKIGYQGHQKDKRTSWMLNQYGIVLYRGDNPFLLRYDGREIPLAFDQRYHMIWTGLHGMLINFDEKHGRLPLWHKDMEQFFLIVIKE